MKPETLIRVHRDEKDVGYFTREAAIEGLRSGVLRSDDWAYCDGLCDWMYLSQILEASFVVAKPPPIPRPPPLPEPGMERAVPAVVLGVTRPGVRKSPLTAFVVAGAAVSFLGLLFVMALVDSSPLRSSSTYTPPSQFESEGHGQRDAGLLAPLENFDLKAEPIEPIPELGMSSADVTNFREWMAAGAPRYWKGKDQFPELSHEQWEQWRKSTREMPDRQ